MADHYLIPDENGVVTGQYTTEERQPDPTHFLNKSGCDNRYNENLIGEGGYIYIIVNNEKLLRTEAEIYGGTKTEYETKLNNNNEISKSNKEMIQGIDDLIQILIDKSIITEIDLPVELKDRWNIRKIQRQDI